MGRRIKTLSVVLIILIIVLFSSCGNNLLEVIEDMVPADYYRFDIDVTDIEWDLTGIGLSLIVFPKTTFPNNPIIKKYSSIPSMIKFDRVELGVDSDEVIVFIVITDGTYAANYTYNDDGTIYYSWIGMPSDPGKVFPEFPVDVGSVASPSGLEMDLIGGTEINPDWPFAQGILHDLVLSDELLDMDYSRISSNAQLITIGTPATVNVNSRYGISKLVFSPTLTDEYSFTKNGLNETDTKIQAYLYERSGDAYIFIAKSNNGGDNDPFSEEDPRTLDWSDILTGYLGSDTEHLDLISGREYLIIVEAYVHVSFSTQNNSGLYELEITGP
jgi:hypothetical protein